MQQLHKPEDLRLKKKNVNLNILRTSLRMPVEISWDLNIVENRDLIATVSQFIVKPSRQWIASRNALTP